MSKMIIRICNSKKGRQRNGQKKKTTHDNPKNITQKTKDRATRILLKPGHGGDRITFEEMTLT
jgi:mannose-6-phosphate isomerase-like protein (cupin superfamily)